MSDKRRSWGRRRVISYWAMRKLVIILKDLIYGCCDRCLILTGIRVTPENQLMRVWLRWPARTDAKLDSIFPTLQMYTSELTNLAVTNCIRKLIVRIVKSVKMCYVSQLASFLSADATPSSLNSSWEQKIKTLPSRHQSMLQIWKRSFFVVWMH